MTITTVGVYFILSISQAKAGDNKHSGTQITLYFLCLSYPLGKYDE